MATKKLDLFEYLSSEGVLHIGEISGPLLLWGLLYIIPLALLCFSFSICMLTGGPVEYYDSLLTEVGFPGRSTDHVPGQSYKSAFHPGVAIQPLFHEYLKSHFGEKRLADPDSLLTNLYFGAQTALLYSAVFCLRALPEASVGSFGHDLRRHMVRCRLLCSGLLKEKIFV